VGFLGFHHHFGHLRKDVNFVIKGQNRRKIPSNMVLTNSDILATSRETSNCSPSCETRWTVRVSDIGPNIKKTQEKRQNTRRETGSSRGFSVLFCGNS
jgi:hypothetical protein